MCPTCRMRRFFVANSASCFASDERSVMGFSTNTSFPTSRNERHKSKCVCAGVTITAASTPAMKSLWLVERRDSSMPNLRAASSCFGRTSETNSSTGSACKTRRWLTPQRPNPSNRILVIAVQSGTPLRWRQALTCPRSGVAALIHVKTEAVIHENANVRK